MLISPSWLRSICLNKFPRFSTSFSDSWVAMKVAANFFIWIVAGLLWSIWWMRTSCWSWAWGGLSVTPWAPTSHGKFRQYWSFFPQVAKSCKWGPLLPCSRSSSRGLHQRAITIDIEFEFADLFDDGLIAVAVEGRHCGQQDIENDPGWPNIAVVIVRSRNDFRGDVVRLNYAIFTVPTNFFSPLLASSARMSFFQR